MRVNTALDRRGQPETGFADLRAWTRFLARGWRDPSVAAPGCDLPAADLAQLGIGPLAYRVLRDRRDARAPQFEAQYRGAALRNLATVAQARELLGSRGITPVLVKGGAFLLRHSPSDLGVRAMADFDLLVGPERFDEAFALLTEAGWHRAGPELKYSSRVSPAVTLFSAETHGATVQIDLHRHLAQWPLLKELPAVVIAHAQGHGGWILPSTRHAVLIVALHRARHAFANDGRDLLDLTMSASGIGDSGWAAVIDEARALGLTGALYGAMRQAAWWFIGDGDPLREPMSRLRMRLGRARVALLERMAPPALVMTRQSRWRGPAGRYLGVFPLAFHSLPRSIVAASLYLPRRGGRGACGRWSREGEREWRWGPSPRRGPSLHRIIHCSLHRPGAGTRLCRRETHATMRALITGGAGFIGSHLADALLAAGHRVDVIDNLSTGAMANTEQLKTAANFRYVCLERLLPSLSDPSVAAVSGKILYETDPRRIWYAGGFWWPLTLTLRRRGAQEIDGGRYEAETDVSFVSGCCMLLRADTIARLGMFEDRFFAYGEDLDWSLRARAAGLRLRFVPSAVLWHRVSASLRKNSPAQGGTAAAVACFLLFRNRLWLVQRHSRHRLQRVFATLAILALFAWLAAGFTALRRWEKLRSAWRGLRAGLSGIGAADQSSPHSRASGPRDVDLEVAGD